MKYLKLVLTSLIIIEVILAAVPLIHVYVNGRYYITYALNLWDGTTYRYLEGLGNCVSWLGVPKDVLLPYNASNIEFVKRAANIVINIINYPNKTLVTDVMGISIHRDGLDFLRETTDLLINSLPKGDYLVLIQLLGFPQVSDGAFFSGSKLLSVIAYVNYGNHTYEVVLDSPLYIGNYLVDDVVSSYDVKVVPTSLIILKVVSWILYPIILVPTALLTYSIITGRRYLRIALVIILISTSVVYVYGILSANPAELMKYLRGPPRCYRVVHKPLTTVIGIRKSIKVNVSNGGVEVVNLGKLIKPYEVKALKMLMNYLRKYELVVIAPSTGLLKVKVVGARELSKGVYLVDIYELSKVKVVIKNLGSSSWDSVEVFTDIYVGVPRVVNNYLVR